MRTNNRKTLGTPRCTLIKTMSLCSVQFLVSGFTTTSPVTSSSSLRDFIQRMDTSDSRSVSLSSVTQRMNHHKGGILRSSRNGEVGENGDEMLDKYLKENNLSEAVRHLQQKQSSSSSSPLTESQILQIFETIETCTSQASETNVNTRFAEEEVLTQTAASSSSSGSVQYPPISSSRTNMTKMYKTLKQMGVLNVFGASNNNPKVITNGGGGATTYLPAMGSKIITPVLLQQITQLPMSSLTPNPSNNLLLAGTALALSELVLSNLFPGFLPYNAMVGITLLALFIDRFVLNALFFETAVRILDPSYTSKIIQHEAGHFLCAYLMGCPVEGVVLNSWDAMGDSRFGNGRGSSVSAGTSFFDETLSEEMNRVVGGSLVSRSSLDRYSVIVMGGIAAEAVMNGKADGGTGDEMALVEFLNNLNPTDGRKKGWNDESIRNQARWGALQAILLIREYMPCYQALVEVLEKNGGRNGLGECVVAIEKAAKENGLGPMTKPVGYILDKGMFGEWTTESPQAAAADTKIEKNDNNQSEGTVLNGKTTIDTKESSGEMLSTYRKKMEEQLKSIDEELNSL